TPTPVRRWLAARGSESPWMCRPRAASHAHLRKAWRKTHAGWRARSSLLAERARRAEAWDGFREWLAWLSRSTLIQAGPCGSVQNPVCWGGVGTKFTEVQGICKIHLDHARQWLRLCSHVGRASPMPGRAIWRNALKWCISAPFNRNPQCRGQKSWHANAEGAAPPLHNALPWES